MTPEKYDPNVPPAGQQPTISSYGFILSPEKDIAKKAPLGIKDPFLQKILFAVGGAVIVVILALVVTSIFFGGKSNVEQLVGISQSQQEIIRINKTYANQLNSQMLKNTAATTQASLQSDQSALLEIITLSGTKIEPKTLALKQDAATDKQFATAKSTNTVDTVYFQILEAELLAYQQELKTAFNGDFGPKTKKLLSSQFAHVNLLREQLAQQ